MLAYFRNDDALARILRMISRQIQNIIVEVQASFLFMTPTFTKYKNRNLLNTLLMTSSWFVDFSFDDFLFTVTPYCCYNYCILPTTKSWRNMILLLSWLSPSRGGITFAHRRDMHYLGEAYLLGCWCSCSRGGSWTLLSGLGGGSFGSFLFRHFNTDRKTCGRLFSDDLACRSCDNVHCGWPDDLAWRLCNPSRYTLTTTIPAVGVGVIWKEIEHILAVTTITALTSITAFPSPLCDLNIGVIWTDI